MFKLNVETKEHAQLIDITGLVRSAVTESGVKEGICTVFVPHTTAAVTINENTDPNVTKDFIMEMDKIIPWMDGYRHLEGNSAAHLKSSIIGVSEQIPIENSRLVLGMWQGIYFCEFDGPRNRMVYVDIH